MQNYREYAGNLHIHSVYSDGHAPHQTIVEAAAKAGLNFVIVTDHNIRPEGLEAYYGRVLLLVGEEVHNARRRPQASHLLVYNSSQELSPYSFGSSHTLIQTALARGGFCYLAHPIEKASPLGPELAAIPWADWPVEGISGLELWNYMSEFKSLAWCRPAALIYGLQPAWGITGPFRATLRLWDELLNQGRKLAVLGNSDAHASVYHWGPLTRQLFPYAYLFRCVNTHVLTQGALTGEVDCDKALLYEALRTGRTWVGYDLPHSTRGFRFVARSGAAQATVGEELRRLGAITFEITLPAPGDIHLLRNGKRVLRRRGAYLQHLLVDPGVYRVEVYRRFWGRKVGWIFSSPIYIL